MAKLKGSPKSGGRKKGVKNIAPRESKIALEELARTHAPAALEALAKVAISGTSEQARVSAAVALLDRGYGKPRQAIDMSGELAIKNRPTAELEARLAQLLGKA